MDYDDLLRSLTAERFNGAWWKPGPVPVPRDEHGDDELTCARRRRELADAMRDDTREEVG